MICTSKSTVALRGIFCCHNILCMYESMRPSTSTIRLLSYLQLLFFATHNTCNVNKLTYYTTLDFVLVFQRDTLRLALFLNHGYYLYLLLTIDEGLIQYELRFCSLLARALISINNMHWQVKMGGFAYPLERRYPFQPQRTQIPKTPITIGTISYNGSK